MGQQTEVGKIVSSYLDKFPEVRSMTLAKLIHKEHPGMAIENIRNNIRYYRGQCGDRNRGRIDPKHAKYQESIAPEPYVEDWEPYHLQKASKKILIINDVHVPYHDVKAIEAVFEWTDVHEVDTIILNGDIIDFYQISKFIKKPTMPHIRQELDMLEDFLWGIRDKFPKAKIVYKEGNHEKRLDDYMRVKAPELYDVVAWSLDEILRFDLLNIDYVRDGRKIVAGGVNILHGNEIPGRRMVNVAKSVYQMTNANTIVGHSHVSDKHTIVSIDDKMRGSWAVGCLCQMHPEYARVNKWVQGFGYLRLLDDSFKMFICEINKGQVL